MDILPLTKVQYQTYKFIDEFIKKKHYCPSFNEIGRHFKLKSNDSVWERINHLISKGHIKHQKYSKRCLILKRLR